MEMLLRKYEKILTGTLRELREYFEPISKHFWVIFRKFRSEYGRYILERFAKMC